VPIAALVRLAGFANIGQPTDEKGALPGRTDDLGTTNR